MFIRCSIFVLIVLSAVMPATARPTWSSEELFCSSSILNLKPPDPNHIARNCHSSVSIYEVAIKHYAYRRSFLCLSLCSEKCVTQTHKEVRKHEL